mmetsp:Transcript_3474/g.10681  ORF Transcript_3474/g.10681 Transcript_3474/m.10681 type:complete len:200 (+) Transcript_3474:1425-2024(+)
MECRRHPIHSRRLRVAASNWARGLPEAKLLRVDRITHVSLAHVPIDRREGHVKIQVEIQNDTRDKNHEDSEGRILEISELHLHRAKLSAPPNVRVSFERCLGWRRLPPHGLPVCRLDVLEMVRLAFVVELYSLAIHDQGVPHEEMGNVPCENLVDSRRNECLVRVLVERRINIVESIGSRIVVLAGKVIANKAGDGIVA